MLLPRFSRDSSGMLTPVDSGLGPQWTLPACTFPVELLIFARFLKGFVLTTGQYKMTRFISVFTDSCAELYADAQGDWKCLDI